MSKIEELIKKHCPNGVEYIPIGQLISRVREKGKNNPDIQTVYAISNKLGVVKSSDYHDFEIHSSDTSNYVVLRKGNFAYNPARLNIGSIAYLQTNEAGLVSPMYVVFQINEKLITQEYLFLVIKSQRVISLINGLTEEGARFRFDFERWNKISIPVPPLPVQEEIVRILDKFTTLEAELEAELDCRKRQYEYYRNKLLSFNDLGGGIAQQVKWVKMSEICISIKDGMHNLPVNSTDCGDYPILSAQNIYNGMIDFNVKRYVDKLTFEKENKRTKVEKNDVLLTIVATIGRSAVVRTDIKVLLQRSVCALKPKKEINPLFLKYYLDTTNVQTYMIANAHGSAQAGLYLNQVAEILIPLPPLSEQERIVAILDKFDALVNDISIGLPAEIEARRKQYEYYRNKLLTFKEKTA